MYTNGHTSARRLPAGCEGVARDARRREHLLAGRFRGSRRAVLGVDLRGRGLVDSEFDEIVSEPAESPRTPPPRLMLCADRSRPARQRPGPRGRDRAGHPRNTGHRPGRSWRRQRSPPRAGKHWQVTEFGMGRAVITPNESPWWRGEVARTVAPLVMRTTRLRND